MAVTMQRRKRADCLVVDTFWRPKTWSCWHRQRTSSLASARPHASHDPVGLLPPAASRAAIQLES